MRSARLHDDGLHRCPWPGEDPLYMAYHDTEWGVPEYDDRALFEKEARALAAHPHPNFVQLLGTSVDGPRLCLVTAFMAGGCVRSRLSSGPLLTWRQRLTAAADACRGLAYLHGPQLGKVHRDIKPANILLDSAQVRGLPRAAMGV